MNRHNQKGCQVSFHRPALLMLLSTALCPTTSPWQRLKTCKPWRHGLAITAGLAAPPKSSKMWRAVDQSWIRKKLLSWSNTYWDHVWLHGYPENGYVFSIKQLHPGKLTVRTKRKGKDRLPTIHFQVRTVSLRDGSSSKAALGATPLMIRWLMVKEKSNEIR